MSYSRECKGGDGVMVIAVDCFLLRDRRGGRGGKLIVVFLQGFLRFDHFYPWRQGGVYTKSGLLCFLHGFYLSGAGGGCILKIDCCVSCSFHGFYPLLGCRGGDVYYKISNNLACCGQGAGEGFYRLGSMYCSCS